MEKIKKEKYSISARTVLWYVVFVGFGVNYMIRINLNIALVSMVKQKPKTFTVNTNECFQEQQILPKRSSFSEPTNISISKEVNDSFTNFEDINNIKSEDNHSFDWNEYIQGLILGAFFWLHWLTQIPGGMLAQKYGAKLVFGLSNFIGVLICFLIPYASYMGYKYLIFLRVLQGLICGVAWPSMHHMTAKWIPPNERSKFVTAYLGSSVGTALVYPLCGVIIDRWGWELVFYISGILGTLWYVGWYFLVYDSPAVHPRISEKERDYILDSLGHSVSKEKSPVPWKAIITSVPVWMNILAQWGGIWGLFTLMTHAPMYFRLIHGWDMKATGLLSGIPHLFRVAFAFVFSALGDYLLKSNKMSRTNVRKLAATQCCIMQGLFMIGLAYSGCNYVAAIIFLSASTAANGAVSTGPLASLVDISPNYASISFGMCNTIVAMVGFLTPAVVSFFTYGNQTVAQWQKVYWIAALMLLVSGVFYLLFSKSELQPWNSPSTKEEDASELRTLNGIDPKVNASVDGDTVEADEKSKIEV